MSRYPLTADAVRAKVQNLSLLPPDEPEWIAFMRDVIRMPMWMLPAVYAAIQQGDWEAAHDPLERIRSAVRRFAIDMKLNNSEKRILVDPEDE